MWIYYNINVVKVLHVSATFCGHIQGGIIKRILLYQLQHLCYLTHKPPILHWEEIKLQFHLLDCCHLVDISVLQPWMTMQQIFLQEFQVVA